MADAITTTTTNTVNQDLLLIEDLKKQMRDLVSLLSSNEELTDDQLASYAKRSKQISLQLKSLEALVLTTTTVSSSLQDLELLPLAKTSKILALLDKF